MRRLFLLWLLLLPAVSAFAQFPPTIERTFNFASSTSSPCYPLNSLGVEYHIIRWKTATTVSGGTIKLQGSNASDCSSPTDIIAATSAIASGTSKFFQASHKYVQMVVASYAGSGNIEAWYAGWILDPSPLITYNSTQPTLTNGQTSDLQISTRGELKGVIMDAAGNARGANVNSSNALSVNVSNFVTESVDNAAFPNTSTEPPLGVGGIYESTLPTYATGDKTTLHMDANGRLIVLSGGTSSSGAVTLDSVNDRASVALQGQSTASINFATGTSPTFTVTAQCSFDDGSQWRTSFFIDQSLAWASTLVNPSLVERTIFCPGGATNAGVEVTSYTSGSTSANVRATAASPSIISALLRSSTGAVVNLATTADNAPLTENPVAVSGIYSTAPADHTDGDKATLLTDIKGRAIVTCFSGCGGSGGTSAVDNTTFTGGTSSVTPSGFLYDLTPPIVADGNVGLARIDANRNVQVNCVTGCAGVADTVGTLVAFDADEDTASVALAGTRGATFHLASGTLAATMVPEVSFDGGTTWLSAVFIQPISGVVSTTLTVTNPNAVADRHIGFFGSATHVRVRVDTFTSGAADAQLRATTANPASTLYSSDGTQLQAVKVNTLGELQVGVLSVVSGTAAANLGKAEDAVAASGDTGVALLAMREDTPTSTAANGDYIVPKTDAEGRLFATVSNFTVDVAHDSPITTVAPVLVGAYASAAAPAAVSADGDAVRLWALRNGSLVNQLAFAGTLASTGNGTQDGGTLRVSIASDSTGQVAIASLPNEGEQTAANSISVTLSSDNDPIAATGGAVPGEAIQIAGTDGTNLRVPYIDPCQREARTVYRVDIATAATTEIAAAVSGEFYYLCSINLFTAGANNVIIVEDDTATNCPSPTAGVSSGGTTAAEGWNFAANQGIVTGQGHDWIMKTTTANRSICIITSQAVQLSGTITYVSEP